MCGFFWGGCIYIYAIEMFSLSNDEQCSSSLGFFILWPVWLPESLIGTPLWATAYRAVANEAVKRPILFFFFLGIIDRGKKLIRHPTRLEGGAHKKNNK
jgi:hypothetical protein